MVVGLDRFAAHFAAYEDRYVLIGGAATWLVLDEAGSKRAPQEIWISSFVSRRLIQRLVQCSGSSSVQVAMRSRKRVRAPRFSTAFADRLSRVILPCWSCFRANRMHWLLATIAT